MDFQAQKLSQKRGRQRDKEGKNALLVSLAPPRFLSSSPQLLKCLLLMDSKESFLKMLTKYFTYEPLEDLFRIG